MLNWKKINSVLELLELNNHLLWLGQQGKNMLAIPTASSQSCWQSPMANVLKLILCGYFAFTSQKSWLLAAKTLI